MVYTYGQLVDLTQILKHIKWFFVGALRIFRYLSGRDIIAVYYSLSGRSLQHPVVDCRWPYKKGIIKFKISPTKLMLSGFRRM